MTDPVRGKYFTSARLTNRFGVEPVRALLEQPNLFFDTIHPEDRLRVLGTLQSELDAPYELEYRIVRPDSMCVGFANEHFQCAMLRVW